MRPRNMLFAVLVMASQALAQDGLPKPTDEHKILASDVGTWDAEVKSYMPGTDAPAMISKGKETNTMLPGGMWLVTKFEGDFSGLAFEGRGQFGYDPQKKKYVGTWVDSMIPSLSVLEGSYDAKTKTMTYVGDGVDPASKLKFTQKMVTVTKDDGSRTFTLHMKFENTDKELKLMEISYTKRK